MSFFNEFKTDLSQAVDELAAEAILSNGATEAPDMAADAIPDPVPKEQPVQIPKQEPIAPQIQYPQQTSAPINTTLDTPMFQTTETAIISSGVSIKGDIKADCPVQIKGRVTGNVKTTSSLMITGSIRGNSTADSIHTDAAQIRGEMRAKTTINIGKDSVVQGNISAETVTIAGAVQGDLDVNGQVTLENSAVVVGSVKAKNLQISNGAVLEGPCSLCYADKKPSDFFGVEHEKEKTEPKPSEHQAVAQTQERPEKEDRSSGNRPDVKTNYGERAWA